MAPCDLHRKKINVSTVLAGQRLGIKEVDAGIWLVSFIHYDLGYFDLEQKTLQPLESEQSLIPETAGLAARPQRLTALRPWLRGNACSSFWTSTLPCSCKPSSLIRCAKPSANLRPSAIALGSFWRSKSVT
jgi:hypothetical protein